MLNSKTPVRGIGDLGPAFLGRKEDNMHVHSVVGIPGAEELTLDLRLGDTRTCSDTIVDREATAAPLGVPAEAEGRVWLDQACPSAAPQDDFN